MFTDLLENSKCQIKWNSGQFWTSVKNISWMKEENIQTILGVTHKWIQKPVRNRRNCRIPQWNRGGGEGPLVYTSSFSGGRIIERGSFLCAGYKSTRGYASKLRLRVPVFVHSVLSWSLDHRTMQFLMCWLRVKIKGKGTGVRGVCRGAWIIELGSLLCAGYASTCGYASK